MENNKQTALQFFLTGLIDLEIGKDLSNDDVRQMHDLYQIAKEMEKKQIMDAYDDGHSDGYLVARDMEEIVKYTNSEKYYNEEYGK